MVAAWQAAPGSVQVIEGILDDFRCRCGGVVAYQQDRQPAQGAVVLVVQGGHRLEVPGVSDYWRPGLRCRGALWLGSFWPAVVFGGVPGQPGPVPAQAGCHVVPGRELGCLPLGELLVEPGQQLVLTQAGRPAPAGVHDDGPSPRSLVNGQSGPSWVISWRRARCRCTLTVFSAMPRAAAISVSFMSCCQRS